MAIKKSRLRIAIVIVIVITLSLGGIGILFGLKALIGRVAELRREPSAMIQDLKDLSTPAREDALLPYDNAAMGFAISYPQCPNSFPSSSYEYGILGVTDGRSFTHNPCLKQEISWAQKARHHPSFYINLSFPQASYPALVKSFQCVPMDEKCVAYQFGKAIARDAYDYAQSQGLTDVPWWLDMQTISTWSPNKDLNAQVVQGAVDFYKSKNLPVGLSTTPYQWNQIAGDYVTHLPNWVPGRVDKKVAAQYCLTGKSYSGGWVQQVAYVENNFEVVYACGDDASSTRGPALKE